MLSDTCDYFKIILKSNKYLYKDFQIDLDIIIVDSEVKVPLKV